MFTHFSSLLSLRQVSEHCSTTAIFASVLARGLPALNAGILDNLGAVRVKSSSARLVGSDTHDAAMLKNKVESTDPDQAPTLRNEIKSANHLGS